MDQHDYDAEDRGEHEHKFLLSSEQAAAFLARVTDEMTPLVHDPRRPVAYSRTTYLDTEDFRYLRSSGGATSKRLRIREYASGTATGEPTLTGGCFVELKESTGSLRSKVRCAAPAEELRRLLRGEVPGESALTTRTNFAWMTLLKRIVDEQPRPQVTTWYRRESMIAEGGRVRVTVDRDLLVCAPTGVGKAGEKARPPEVIEALKETIVEVKITGALPPWLEAAVADLPRAEERFSKFRRAMAALAARRETRSA